MLIVVLKIAFCFLLALAVTSVSECLFHKYLFHKNIKWVARITKLWNYNPERHTHHHKVCFKEMDDAVDSEEEYWVQRPSNTFAACGVVSLIEVLFLWLIGFQWPYMVLQVFFTICTFTFWYYFEDHFHLAMHKPDYYKKHIQGTWQDPWFKYCRRLHAIHHKNFKYNYGFIYFPIGDLILGTFKNEFPKEKKEEYSH